MKRAAVHLSCCPRRGCRGYSRHSWRRHYAAQLDAFAAVVLVGVCVLGGIVVGTWWS